MGTVARQQVALILGLLVELTFHAKMMRTGPTGTLRMNLLKPASGSPSVSLRASSLIFRRYSARLMAVVISLPVYARGRPIWTVSSRARSSVLAARSVRAFFTMICLSASGVVRHDLKASVVAFGRRPNSTSEMPLRVRIGSFVVGEMVVKTSADMMKVLLESSKSCICTITGNQS